MTEGSGLALELLEAAVDEIVAQAAYYAETGGDSLAERWGNAVRESIQSLLPTPHRGAPCTFFSPPYDQLRRIPVRGFDRFLIFYRVDLSLSTLFVYAVLHSARDVARIVQAPRA